MKIMIKIQITILVAGIFSVALGVHWENNHIIWGSVASMVGLSSYSFYLSDLGEKRMVACLLSLIPGAGHLYLKKGKRSIPFFSAIAVILSSLYLSAIYPSDTEFIVLAITIVTAIYALWISYADIERLCDEVGIPYPDPMEKVQAPQSKPNYDIVTFFASVVVLSITFYFLLFDWNADRTVWIYAVTGAAWSIALCISLIGIRQWFSIRKNNTQ
jgi:hypothetical protein